MRLELHDFTDEQLATYLRKYIKSAPPMCKTPLIEGALKNFAYGPALHIHVKNHMNRAFLLLIKTGRLAYEPGRPVVVRLTNQPTPNTAGGL